MNAKKICLIFLVLLSTLGIVKSRAYGYEPDLPADFPELIITKTADAAPGVLIGDIETEDDTTWYVILDRSGYPLFYSKTEELNYFIMPNGLIGVGDKKLKGFRFKDETFAEVDTFTLQGEEYALDSHDVYLMPNGHCLLIGKEYRNVDMSKLVPDGKPDAVVTGNIIQEFDANKELIFEWHTLDHMSILDSFWGLTKKSIDYAHVNSIRLDPTDNTIICSFRQTTDVVKISRTTGEIVWRLGGQANDFTFVGEHEENAPFFFIGQHSALRYPNGNLTLFDNGANGRGEPIPGSREYCRAVEYKLDEVNMTATLLWDYRHEPDLFASSRGDVRRLINGNTYIEWGGEKRRHGIICTEVTPSGETVFEMAFANPGGNSHLIKELWNSPDLVTSQTYTNIEEGQTYDSDTTGVSVTVNSMTGAAANNGLIIKKHDVSARFPRFSDRAPQLLVKRVTLAGFGIDSSSSSIQPRSFGFQHLNETARQKRAGKPKNKIAHQKKSKKHKTDCTTDTNLWSLALDITFSTQDLDAMDASQLTVYHRPCVGAGEFSALATTFDEIDETLTVTNASLGEYVFAFPDAAEVANAPTLIVPGDDGTVNQDQSVTLDWNPNGFSRSFALQVATDANFKKIILNESGLKQSSYELASVDPRTTYYWRVNTTNLGGTSDWATQSFSTVPAMVEVVTPNGGENLNRFLDEYIIWNDNLAEDVVIELYKDNVFVLTIGTVPSIGAFEWEVDGSLDPGCDYTIKIKSSLTDSIADTSDAPFHVDIDNCGE